MPAVIQHLVRWLRHWVVTLSNWSCLISGKGTQKHPHCCLERVEDLDLVGVVYLDARSCLGSDDSASLGCDVRQFTLSYQLRCCSKRVGDLDPVGVVYLSFLEGTLTRLQQFASCAVALTLWKLANLSKCYSRHFQHVWNKRVAPCSGINDSHGSWIPRRGFRIPSTEFPFFASGTWIPDSNR